MGFLFLLLLVALHLLNATIASPTASPIIDLGYTLQKGTLSNSDGFTYYNFTNVRYAAPPTGPRRFKPPSSPPLDRVIHTNRHSVICPQASPGWVQTALTVLGGGPVIGTSVPRFTRSDIPPSDPRTSEDCLFLDLIVPTSVYHNRNHGPGAPVLVWIHSGGYVMGYKDQFGNGLGLVTRSRQYGRDGIIYVAINYRLGLFGWLAGPSSKNRSPRNLGLLDQRFALEWVQQYIHLFGGDPDQVTVEGESSGGGSILAHITSCVNTQDIPFAQAVTQSPYLLYISPTQQKVTYQQTLKYAEVNSYSALQAATTQQLQAANALVIGNALPYGTFPFGPVIDGSYLPDLPSILLKEGRYKKSLKIITGHCSDEGLQFTSPFITDSASYSNYLKQLFPNISKSSLSYIQDVLYPPVFDGSFGYVTQMGRTNLTIGDAAIVCNARYLDHAFPGQYAYEFTVPPGFHAEDTSYIFFDSGADSGLNTTLAQLLQRYITRFAEAGTPNGPGLPNFVTNRGSVVQNLNSSYVGPIQDEARINQRCAWWQKGLYR